MPHVDVRAVVYGLEALSALRLVTDYRRWPEVSDAVRSVHVEKLSDGSSVSSWEVTFRGGLMCWSERDTFDTETLEHRFALIEGDPDRFAGAWTAEPHENGCTLQMLADFDLGMPSLRHVIDPIAVEALEDAIVDVVRVLFGRRVTLLFGGGSHDNKEELSRCRS